MRVSLPSSSRATGLWLIGMLCVGLGAGGCATHTINLQTGPRAFTADEYELVYEGWTRSEDDFAWTELDDILHVTATFESWEFRWAYVARYARDHSIEESARAAMLRATLADATQHHRFFVTLSGPVFREQDLTSPRSGWRVLLVDEDGRQTTPIEMRKVRHPTAAELIYFPSVSPHRQAFRIVFPARREDGTETIPVDARTIKLRFAGARGQVNLEWEIPTEAAAAAE